MFPTWQIILNQLYTYSRVGTYAVNEKACQLFTHTWHSRAGTRSLWI